jgi:hypothetical protein
VYCDNAACPAQAERRLRHYVSRGAADIESIGIKLVQALLGASLVHDPGDLYRLTKEQLLGLERIADKSAQNILDNIEASKMRPLGRILFGLGIRHVGERLAEFGRRCEQWPGLQPAPEPASTARQRTVRSTALVATRSQPSARRGDPRLVSTAKPCSAVSRPQHAAFTRGGHRNMLYQDPIHARVLQRELDVAWS